MRLVALIPAKPLIAAKSRLAGALSDEERAAASLRMLCHVVSEALRAPEIDAVGVISSDQQVLNAIVELGAESLVEHGAGLNHALYLGRRWAIEQQRADALLVVLSDLPLVRAEDLSAVAALAAQANVAIAPSKDGGTNALLLRPPDAIPFRFGTESADQHRREAGTRGLQVAQLDRETLAFDVDTLPDYEAWRKLHAGVG